MLDRTLVWDGCLNVRDLGGHETGDGGRTRFGAVVRADSVRRLSDEGWRDVVGYGIRSVVDLRFHSELEADPPHDVPVDVVHVPLFPEPDSPQWAELEDIGRAVEDAAGATREVYLALLERCRPRFGEAIAAVADAREGGVLVHCTAGKDRTGLVSALLLRLAGVAIPEIGADYALSEANLASATRIWIDEAVSESDRRRRIRLSVTPAASMIGVVEELERRYGAVDRYLRGAGATGVELARARDRLLE